MSATVEHCNVLLVVKTNTQANKHGKSYVQNKFQNQLMKVLKQAINNSVKGGNLTLKTLKSEIIYLVFWIFFFSSDVILKLDLSFDIFTHAAAGLWIKYSFHIPILVRQKKKNHEKTTTKNPLLFSV